ncbi:hypothetical protein DSAG12_03005 [Promethearchaeum syntrophicum]|uniref:Uncharacterized protein n=1 Tax=Promethearchaeum syntrophicum TaxID=2594042 RepID=A0A5B9DEH4_9ARCH|nr:hypothetical protein [Candidatus Prometheoarchaeum syntrophicum]QEE17173.1 Tyrosine recombinase XerC [Candidatus Prometheoarchaeum syntrophicum]
MRRPTSKQLIKKFTEYLTIEKKLKSETINKHISIISFFYESYLNQYEEMHLLDVEGFIIEDYLGNWYIRKVSSSNKGEIVEILASFKKFYKFLLNQGYIMHDQYEEILAECKNSKKYYSRFTSYWKIDFDQEEGENSWMTWMMGEEPNEDSFHNLLSSLINSRDVDTAQKDLQEEPISPRTLKFLADFKKFLKYCTTNHEIKVSKRQLTLPRKHLFAINEQLSSPEVLKPYVFQWDANQIHLFYHIGLSLGCILVDDSFSLQTTKRIEQYLTLSPQHQLIICLYCLWEVIPWANLLSPTAGGRPEWSQDGRIILQTALADATVDHPYDYTSYILQYSPNQNFETNFHFSSLYNWGVVPTKILPSLERMGLLMCTFKNPDELKYSSVSTITILKFGKMVFSCYKEFIIDKMKN